MRPVRFELTVRGTNLHIIPRIPLFVNYYFQIFQFFCKIMFFVDLTGKLPVSLLVRFQRSLPQLPAHAIFQIQMNGWLKFHQKTPLLYAF